MTAALRAEHLAPFEGRRDLTLDELVDAAESLLAAVAPVQQRYKVTARPDVRTIRYYTSLGLLPKPVGYDGGRARYALTHLLRLLLIKKLQAEHHTLTRIKQELAGVSDDEIRRALVVTSTSGASQRSAGEAPKRTHAKKAPPPRAEAEREPLSGEDAPLEVEALLSLTLADGDDALAHLTFPPDVLRDPARRARLAEQLRALALRLTQGESP